MKRSSVFLVALFALSAAASHAQEKAELEMERFLGFRVEDGRERLRENPKTLFQTNMAYDPRIALPVDGVIVHRHGADAKQLTSILRSWRDKGFAPQRMFFADSDAGWVYTKGKFDGEQHLGDIELDRQGKQVLCANVRPYMLPTPGWTAYLKTQIKHALDGGARAIYPEEPLAHKHTGYEESFKDAYRKRYGGEWTPPHESNDAFFKTCRLKNELYLKLEQDLYDYTAAYSLEKGQPAEFLIPIHSLYSNLSAGLVAPLGTSLALEGHRGYIGQIWTGPVLWTLGRYSDKEATFFDAAYVLYDYFVNLVDRSDKRLYLLTDPVEDHPDRTWPDYEKWYKDCVVAELLFTNVDRYEVMPWPDRIFMPGYQTGGGTPGPAHYRTIIMSVVEALQQMPAVEDGLEGGAPGVGMLIGDTAMWQHLPHNVQDPFLPLLLPLVKAGIPVSSVPVERLGDKRYMEQFKMLLLSYEGWKPAKEEYHDRLAAWVKAGGVLALYGDGGAFDKLDAFWARQGCASPTEHLLRKFGDAPFDNMIWASQRPAYQHKKFGNGHLVRPLNGGEKAITPGELAQDKRKRWVYLQMLEVWGSEYAGLSLNERKYFLARRGPFVICRTQETKKKLPGRFLDIFTADLKVLRDPELPENTSALLYDIDATAKGETPRLLYATYRLMGKREAPGETAFFIQGPTGTEGRARLYTAGKTVAKIDVVDAAGAAVKFAQQSGAEQTLLLSFPYHAAGLGFKIRWR